MLHLIFAPFGIIFGVLYLIFWIVMLVDCIQNPRLNDTERVVWVLVLLIAQFIGPILYFFIGRKR